MPLANSSGPEWLRGTELSRRTAPGWPNLIDDIFRSIRRLFSGSRRRPKSQAADDAGNAAAGDRSPLIPPVPTLSGANAKRLEDEADH
jgi:hypothetical protein